MKEKRSFKPQDLRSILSVLLALIIMAGAGAFYYGLNIVRDYSEEVNQRLVDAEASGNQLEDLQTLRRQLNQSDSLVQKADRLFATPSSYQSRALSDVRNYANDAGIEIARTEFGDSNPHQLTVTFTSPTSYSGLIAFLNNIETNLPKMQVESIDLGHVNGGGADTVKVNEIKIDVSVR